LTSEIERWKSEGANVILGGDFNENLGETIDGLAHLVSTCLLMDVHAHFHGIKREPTTYVRGNRRLDYVFITEGVIPFVRAYGIEPFFATIHSDHQGLFLDLDLAGLLGSEMAQLLPPALRGISGNSPHYEKYINKV
jgi:endonuclease/exonuclease/phosphatase family metal-dependent hydrolase